MQGDDGSVKPIGAMFCLWCDFPQNSYNETEVQNVKSLMKALSDNNTAYFPHLLSNSDKLYVGGAMTLSVSTGKSATWSVDNPSVIALSSNQGSSVTATANDRGTATVTATTANGKALTTTLTVTGEGDEQVTINVNETWTKTVRGQDLRDQVTGGDNSIANINITCKQEQVDAPGAPATSMTEGASYYIKNNEGKYLNKDAKWVDNADEAAQWQWINYGSSGYYLKLDSTHWLYYNGSEWSVQWWYSNCTYFNNSLTDGALVSRDGQYLGIPVEKDTIDVSTISITGKAVGDTDATIGNAQYHITVMPSDALKADSITLEYMITTCRVHDYTSSNDRYTITSAAASDAAGVDVSTLAPVNGYFYRDNNTGYPKMDATYWQTMRLDKDHKQADYGWGDSTGDGTPLTRVRSHSGAWQYQTADGTWQYFRTGDQLISYYVQKTDVTKDVITYTKDWGEVVTSTQSSSGNNNNGQVALTFAVVYPDGTVSPKEGDMYPGATTIFNYESGGRDIGVIMPKNNENYNISKITVTDGKRATNTSVNQWYSSDTITWNTKTTAAGGKWYNETEVWNKASGTDPVVNGKTCENGMWTAKNTAKLVLIYLEPVVKETNLNIVYWDDTANKQINPNTIQISMAYNQGGTKPTYFTALCDANGNVIGDKGPWNSNVVDSANYLPNDAYVVNSSNVHQTISKDMTQIEGIAGNYTSGLYEYRSADISTDGKTLTLHYGLKNTGTKTYVVDFGLPVTIPLSDLGITDLNTISWISLKQETQECLRDHGTYGTAVIDKVNKTVTYTLDQTLDNEIAIPINIKFTNSDKIESFSFHVIPATSVYYEDSFASFTNGTGKAADATWSIVGNNGGVTEDKSTSKNQALTELGKMSADDVYGHDTAYADSTKLSMGSARKVTVNAGMVKDWTENSAWPTATFTFKGTGFDVISLTDNNSGAIAVDIYKSTGERVKGYVVNNYYGYTYNEETQTWEVNNSTKDNALYQIPVMKVNGLTYGEYTVKISVAYDSNFDKTGDSQFSFWLDAIRVYDPMGKDKEAYTQDNEGYPQYIKLHDAIVGHSADIKNTVFVDGGANATLTQYTNHGPNNEVYLTNGQAISFKLTGDLGSIASVQIGAKTPNGTGDVAKISVNGQEVKTATEMYYAITAAAKGGQQVTIANDGSGILSLTNLKITYKESGKSVSLAPLTTADQENAVAQVRALFAAPAEPFQPDRFEASWGRAVRKGNTATLTVKTSEDVDSITVDDQAITTYDTKTERTGWGWWAKTVTYREFTYQVAAEETTDYTICAVNSAGVSSDPITVTLTVRPSIRDWWHGIFDKWF